MSTELTDTEQPFFPVVRVVRREKMAARSWEKIAMYIFQYKRKDNLVIINYYSRWIEIKQLNLNDVNLFYLNVGDVIIWCFVLGQTFRLTLQGFSTPGLRGLFTREPCCTVTIGIRHPTLYFDSVIKTCH